MILISWRICMICIWIDSKFEADSSSAHVKVIWVHLRGHKRSFRDQKGRFGVKNLKHVQMHAIYIWIDSKFSSESYDMHVKVIRGHLRGHKRSFRDQKGHFGVKSLKHVQMHMIYIWINSKFCSEFNGVHFKDSRGHLRGQKRSFWGHKSETRPNTPDMHMIWFQILFWF